MIILKRVIAFVMDILETITFVGSIFIVVYLYILQPNQVKGASMEPTFQSGDYILTSKITYKMRRPQRGDIVVFRSPRNPDIEFIKRVIGISGDKIVIQNSKVFVNEEVVNEDYINGETSLMEGKLLQEGESIIVGEGELFVLGDNRPNSSDSRDFGTINQNDIIGQVFYRYFPPQKVGSIANPYPSDLR